MLLDNKYSKWYFQIIENARRRSEVLEYSERHHIIPKCINGSNKKENLVSLTYREHFLVHWLLTKMVTDAYKIHINHAFSMMISTNRKLKRHISSWQYTRLRIACSESNSGVNHYLYGKKHSEVTKAKMSKAHLGKKHSEEHKRKNSEAKLGKNHPLFGKFKENHPMYGRKHSDETKAEMSKIKIETKYMVGTKRSEETKAKIRQKALGHKRNIGHKHTQETKYKMKIAGEKREAKKVREWVKNNSNKIEREFMATYGI
jgi:5-methylcytosine-specific restriction endonuclease McrA